MKKILAVVGILSALVLTVSCQKDQNYLRASFSPYQGGGKVYIQNQYACWSIGDTVWINGNGTDYTIASMGDNDGSFLINTGSTVFSRTPLTALYPSNVIASGSTVNDDNQINITLPQEQKYVVKEGEQIVYAPMVATVTTSASGGGNLVFTNLCSLLKVQVHPNVFVHTITVRIADGSTQVPLAGPATVNFSSKTLTMASSGTSSSITLTVNNSRSDGIYYIVVPPYATSTKLEVEVWDNPHSIIKVRQKNAFSLDRNIIATINCIDGGKGLFSVANGVKVSFAKGNLTLNGSNYSFQDQQTSLGSTFVQSDINNNNLSSCMGNDWFILSDSQWDYLLNDRPNASNLRARANIEGQCGLILLPDAWASLRCPIDVADDHNFQSLIFEDDWQVLESYGAVFLPAPSNNGTMYWSTTTNKVLTFANGNGNGGNGGMYTLKKNEQNSSAYIRHAHYVVGGPSNTSNSQGE